MAAAMRITLLAVAAMAVLGTASAMTYTVGGPSGAWDLNTDYGTWVSDKKFLTGDSIVFTYDPQQHSVLEVSKADYDSCNTASPIKPFTTGNDTVVLTASGTRYFICGVPGHCKTTGTTGNMKVTIDVASGSSPSPPAPANGPSASNSPPPSPPAPANGPSASNSPPAPLTPASGPGASSSPPPPQTPSAATSVGATAGLGLAVLLAGLMA
ncbi:unnamed protein product [Alopecurus aequalis]